MISLPKLGKKEKVEKETINDQYDESSRILTDEEAHRNVSYELPSFVSQTMQCFIVQMKRYMRQKIMVVSLVLLALIPIGYLLIKAVTGPGDIFPDSDSGNAYLATMLCAAPAIIPLLSSIACGSMLSQEFNERTVFLSLPLPMSRASFYLGKFLAGFVLIEGVVAAAFGLSVLMSMMGAKDFYTSTVFSSYLLCFGYAMFCCAVSYALSGLLKRGSSMLPFAILFVGLPLICVLLMMYGGDFLSTVFSYVPCMAPDMAINQLGKAMMVFSIPGVTFLLFSGHQLFSLCSNNGAMIIVSILLSLIILAAGYLAVKRRDM